jgi:hypothetical protein
VIDDDTPVGTKVLLRHTDLRGETIAPVNTENGKVAVKWEGLKEWTDTEDVEDLEVAYDQTAITPFVSPWKRLK